MTDSLAHDWIPEACTLPTAERPLRQAEFDELFTRDVQAVVRESPQRIRLVLRADPDTAARAADLAVRETSCCSLFTFELAIAEQAVSLAVEAGPAHAAVLAAIGARAESLAGAAS